MRPPGFSAEASLYRPRQYYATAFLYGIDSAQWKTVLPAAPVGGTINVGGTIWDNKEPCHQEWGPCDSTCHHSLTGCGKPTRTESCCPIDAHCQNGTCICPGNKKMCGGVCVDVLTDPNHCGGCDHPCSPGSSCANGTCTSGPVICPPGLTNCGGTCTNLLFDNSNCGACGTVCTTGVCCSGVCGVSCGSGRCCPGPTTCCTGTSGGNVCCDPGSTCCPGTPAGNVCCDPGFTCRNWFGIRFCGL